MTSPEPSAIAEAGKVELTDILARLEKAEGPDRELDGLIYGHFEGLKRNDGTFHLDIDGERFQFEHPTLRHPAGPAALYVHGYNVGEFTASLDAALALVERCLPGAYWRAERLAPALTFDGEPFWASCGLAGAQEAAHAKTPAIALLIALVKALIARDGDASSPRKVGT